MKITNNKYGMMDIVSYNGVECQVVDIIGKRSTTEWFYDLHETNGDGEYTDVPEGKIRDIDEDEEETNKYEVPYHCYALYLLNGEVIEVDVGCEDDWGDIQECLPSDDGCEDDWKVAVGWGNDSDGHTKIIRVVDMEDNSEWIGNNAIRAWANDCVWKYVDNYSG